MHVEVSRVSYRSRFGTKLPDCFVNFREISKLSRKKSRGAYGIATKSSHNHRVIRDDIEFPLSVEVSKRQQSARRRSRGDGFYGKSESNGFFF